MAQNPQDGFLHLRILGQRAVFNGRIDMSDAAAVERDSPQGANAGAGKKVVLVPPLPVREAIG